MSISSCKFDCGSVYAEVKRKKYCVDIEFTTNPYYGRGTTNSITVNSSNTLDIPVNPGPYNVQFTGGLANTNTSHQCMGYRLFFLDGYLKCIKKEMAVYQYYHVSGSVNGTISNSCQTPPKLKGKACPERFYHPSAIWDSVSDPITRNYIQKEVCELAYSFGIKIPKEFNRDGDTTECIAKGYTPGQAKYGYYFAALDWLAYPLVREIGSPALCKNMRNADRNVIAPKFKVMNFKDLVEHYYGTSTNKMLAEIWKVITTGGDVRRHCFLDPKVTPEYSTDIKSYFLETQDPTTILSVGETDVYLIGDRRIQKLIFSLGPVILKTMGFDYFYQAIPKFDWQLKASGDYAQGYPDDQAPSYTLEENFTTILKSVSPKKLLGILFDGEKMPDTSSLNDTARMIREYEDPQNIPKTLKLQYPIGLVVDFKFKTMKELHDKISTQYTIIKTEASKKEIPVNEVYLKLEGREKNGLRLRVPTNTTDLALWGKLINICIASYGDSAARGGTLLLGVEKDGAIKYCIEFDEICVRRARPIGAIRAYVGNNLSDTTEPAYVEEVYPLLEERHYGVTPTDVSPEDEIYYMPSIVQFRGQRNCNPEKADENDVYLMLRNWVKENFEFLSSIKGIFDGRKKDMWDNIREQAINQAGQPDQILMNPRAYQDLHNALRREGDQLVPVQANDNVPFAAGVDVEVVVDANVPRNQFQMYNAQGYREVVVRNINVD